MAPKVTPAEASSAATARVSPLHRLDLTVIAASLLVLTACGTRPFSQAPSSVEQVEQLQRTAHARDVLAAAERGLTVFADPAKPEHWRLRLVQAAALSSLERFEERTQLLRKSAVPSGLQASEPAVQFRLLQNPPPPGELARLAAEESRLGLQGIARRHRATAAVQLLYSNAEDGRKQLQDILVEARQAKDARIYSYAAGELGFFLASQFRLDEGLQMLRQAREMAATAAGTLTVAYADANIGWLHQITGKEEDAIEAYSNAASIFGRLGVFAEQRRALRNLGSIYFHNGNHDKAGEYFEQARQLIQPESPQDSVGGLWSDIAANYVATGRMDAAEQAMKEATAPARRHKEIFEYPWILLTSGRIAESHGQDPLPFYREAIAITGRDHTAPLEAFIRMGRWLRAQKRTADAEQAYQNAVQMIAKLRATLQQDDSKIGFASTVNRVYQDYVDLLIESGREQQALILADSSRLQVFSENRKQSSDHLEVAKLTRVLAASDTTALFYWLGPERSYVWVIDGSGARLVRNLPASGEIANWVREYGRFTQAGRDPRGSDFNAPRSLWTELIQKPGVAGLRRVVIVPDGSLHWLNFETLPTPDGRFWIEQARLVVSPALRIMTLSNPAPASTLATALLVGDATGGGAEYPPLTHAGGELRSIAELYGSGATLLSGAAATPEAYAAANPSRFDIIHFAAHAEANARSPLDSAVILSPGKTGFRLFTRDVPRFPLRAGLVTLSACRGAGAQAFAGEGLVGFSWAYLRSGAHQVVAGLWQADDASTARFMRTFYQGIRQGKLSAPDALRAAKLELIKPGGSYAKPYYWGPFQMFAAELERPR